MAMAMTTGRIDLINDLIDLSSWRSVRPGGAQSDALAWDVLADQLLAPDSASLRDELIDDLKVTITMKVDAEVVADALIAHGWRPVPRVDAEKAARWDQVAALWDETTDWDDESRELMRGLIAPRVALTRSSIATEPVPNPLGGLRADVEALRAGVDESHEYRMATEAYEDVLDLIDKHAREGQ